MAGAAEDRRELCTWPRVVRPNRRQRLLGQVAGAVLLAMGLALVGVALSWRPERAADGLSVILAVTGLGFALGGAYCIAWIRSKRVVLFEDAIELVDLGVGRRRLRRDEILGLRIIPRQHGFQRLVFELREAGRKPVKTDLHCERDAALDDWLAAIPDLDARDRGRAEAKLLRRTELGQTEEERRRALARARRVARAATVLSAGTMAWALLYPRPYEAAVATLAAIPLATVALLLAGRGLYAISDARNEIRPSLMVPLFGPGLFLTVRAIFDLHVIDWEPSLVWTALVTLALTVLVMVGEPGLRRRWFAPLGVLLFLAAHPWGALQMANALLDRSEPEVLRVAVLDKHITSAKRLKHRLRLAPWGPAQEGEVTVDSDLYEAVEVGGEVCVALQPGALGVRWFLIGRCDE
ncbi:hypothetical protein [Sorangium cellulosum]|uniref:Uncharacterized protein n=1 Tax=Sorangium cellulosum TaxID=56 RepID=A0A150QNG7_SORCE|nr:hypothetical protein [Sorangium cellulosum]KYF69510.1 hypothetical protein BE15_06775 [Sorangium cellulosum]